MQIRDKVAVITGASGGIGKAVCVELANRQAGHIAMVDMSSEVVHAAQEVNRLSGRAVAKPYEGDTTDPDFRRAVYDEICDTHGKVNICVPAAGIVRDALAVKVNRNSGETSIYPEEVFRLVTEVNYIAPIYWAMELIARVAESRFQRGLRKWGPQEEMEGAIVFIGSVASQGNKGQISYASAKAALDGAASTLMKEAIFHGVRCSIIHPGFTDTPILNAMGQEYVQKYVLPDTQLGRLIRPEEIADAICFMITNQAVSGEIWADAGWHPAAA
ncbi:MAG: SDR family oxidoreductase [Alphaproteobacteria bacterium]|nr:SDR family oxidoreductase [Alphaproteobacteria bacterium]